MISSSRDRMHRCLAAKVMERTVSINLDLLPVDCKNQPGDFP